MVKSTQRQYPSLAGTTHRDAWISLAVLVGLGLYAARLVAETMARPWPLGALLPLALVGVGVSWALLRRVPIARRWPSLLCWAYVLWPWFAPAVGLAFGSVSLVAFLLGNLPSRHDGPLAAVAVFLGFLALYVGTLAPSVLPADSGEFQLVAHVLGVAHPPGYPLYTLLGKLFTLLPIRDPAYRLNLMSAVLGALTLAVMVRTVQQEVGSAVAGLAAAAMLGLSATFWVQSTTANIRSLTALFTALLVTLLLRWGRHRTARDLTWCAACLGLAIGHHASIALLLPAVVGYVLSCDPRLAVQPRRWLAPLGALLASLLVLLYLPLRSLMGAPFDPAPIRSVPDFWEHVTASGFRGDMFYFRTWLALRDRLTVWGQIVRLQFGLPLVIASLLAAVPLAIKHWRSALLLIGIWALNTVAAVTYRAPQTVEYLLPSYVAMALLLGLGLGALWQEVARSARAWAQGSAAILASALLVLAVGHGQAHMSSLAQLHHDTSTRDDATPILRDAPQGSLLLSNWHQATVFWYLQQVEGLRPDVQVRYVYPEGATPNEQVWLRRIAEGLAQGPVIVTNRFPAYAQTDYRWIPLGDAWLVREGPLRTVPTEITSAAADLRDIRLLGYQVDAEATEPGDSLTVRVYWQPLAPLDQDYSSFVQLVGPGGVVGQGDIVHRSRGYTPGEIRVDAYDVPLLLHTTPGSYQLITGFYTVTGDGWQRLKTGDADHVLLTDISVRPASRAWPSGHPLNGRFAGGWRLSGVDADASVPGLQRLYLHWERPRGLATRTAPSQPAAVQLLVGDTVASQVPLPALAPGEAATVAVDLPASTEALAVRLSREGGAPLACLGPWGWPRAALRLPSFDDHARYVPLGGKMALLSVAGVPPAIQRGQTLRSTVRLLALRPLTEDDSVSLGLERSDGTWQVRSDGTPALGAIPTLKWLAGWKVGDLRRLTVPQDAPEGQVILALTVYDAFTVKPLPVLDERLVREGQGTRLRLTTVEITP